MPARLPDRIKNLRGTLRAGRVNKRAPQPRAVRVPAPPRDFSAYERAVWKRLASELAPGVFTASDATAFRLLVRSVATAENPHAEMTDSARIHWARMAAAMLAKFGLTPLDRERVSVAPTVDDPTADGLAEFATDGLRVVR